MQKHVYALLLHLTTLLMSRPPRSEHDAAYYIGSRGEQIRLHADRSTTCCPEDALQHRDLLVNSFFQRQLAHAEISQRL